jgi:hypothetical protein
VPLPAAHSASAHLPSSASPATPCMHSTAAAIPSCVGRPVTASDGTDRTTRLPACTVMTSTGPGGSHVKSGSCNGGSASLFPSFGFSSRSDSACASSTSEMHWTDGWNCADTTQEARCLSGNLLARSNTSEPQHDHHLVPTFSVHVHNSPVLVSTPSQSHKHVAAARNSSGRHLLIDDATELLNHALDVVALVSNARKSPEEQGRLLG